LNLDFEESSGASEQGSQEPGRGPKVLLHTCCAPCLIQPLAILQDRGFEVVPFFYNPNIHPFREYRERYFAVVDYCEAEGLALRAGPYEMELFLDRVAALGPEAAAEPQGGRRCSRCFEMRLDRTAAEARRLSIASFTTTLLVSPYQDQEMIREAGSSAALEHGIHFIFEDMSEGYRASVEKSREAGMYRQSYCGCLYSEKERYQKGDPPRR
jgi:predicted adenine nucleotide alpha hydrolase (AANH) superfamily ATPase